MDALAVTGPSPFIPAQDQQLAACITSGIVDGSQGESKVNIRLEAEP